MITHVPQIMDGLPVALQTGAYLKGRPPLMSFRGVACRESLCVFRRRKTSIPRTTRGVDAFSVIGRAVSSTVSFSRHSVDLRVRCYDTDAQDLA